MEDNKPSVLIVDDEIDLLKMSKRIFEKRGWNVFISPTGAAAMTIAEIEKIDLVLLDVQLVNESGLDVLKELRGKYPTLKILISTGFGYNDKIVNEAMRLGASGYVSKGVSISEFFDVVKNVMAG